MKRAYTVELESSDVLPGPGWPIGVKVIRELATGAVVSRHRTWKEAAPAVRRLNAAARSEQKAKTEAARAAIATHRESIQNIKRSIA
jgi:hypothetical protein